MPEFKGDLPETVLVEPSPSDPSETDPSSGSTPPSPPSLAGDPAEHASPSDFDEGRHHIDEASGLDLAADRSSEDATSPRLSHEVNQSLARLELNSLEVKLYLDAIEEKINRMEPRLEQIRGGQQPLPENLSSSAPPGAEEALPLSTEVSSVPRPVESTTERRRRRLDIPPPTAEADATTHADQLADDDLWSLKSWLLARRKQLAIAGGVFVAFITVLTFGVGSHPSAPAASSAVPANTPAPAPLGSGAVPKASAATPFSSAHEGSPSAISASGTAETSAQPGDSAAGLATPAQDDGRALGANASIDSPADLASMSPALRDPAAGDVPSAGRSVPALGRVRVSSGVMAGNLLYSPTPRYPGGIAALFHMEGKVTLQAIIARNGRVENLRVLSGHRLLRGAAQDAVRTWRYRPFSVNGVPVEVATIVTVEFHR